MSEQPPERPASSGGGGLLTGKMGPLPVWAWLAIMTVVGIGFYLYEQHKKGTAAPAATSTTMSGAAGIPDYVSQTTVNLTEPAESEPVTTGTPQIFHPRPTPKPKPKPGKKPGKKPAKNGGPAETDPMFSGTYTVKPGDTLPKLAEKYGIDLTDLAHANGLGTGAGLRTGKVLHVPGPLKTRAEGGQG